MKHRIVIVVILISVSALNAQHYEVKAMAYNTLIGGVTGGIGSMINKNKEVSYSSAFLRGFLVGCGGGGLMYTGKKINFLVTNRQNLGYCWLSRTVFSAGNSIIENAADNRAWWSRWHFDIAFIRMEYDVWDKKFQPQVMLSSFGGFVFSAFYGHIDLNNTLRSGTLIFRTKKITYASHL